jgi:succinate dehydrogenase / fumarate reductase membrane anchor subunit
MRQTGAYTWLFQRVSGVFLFLLVLVHFTLTHFMGYEKRLYDQVIDRMNNPLWKTFDLVLLFLALYHGLYGVWSVVGDYVTKDSWRIICLIGLVTLGVVMFMLGTVTLLSIPGV